MTNHTNNTLNVRPIIADSKTKKERESTVRSHSYATMADSSTHVKWYDNETKTDFSRPL